MWKKEEKIQETYRLQYIRQLKNIIPELLIMIFSHYNLISIWKARTLLAILSIYVFFPYKSRHDFNLDHFKRGCRFASGLIYVQNYHLTSL
jgi:hypothetical protein